MLRRALLILLLDRRGAGRRGEGARPAVLPLNQIALRLLLEELLDDPRATGLSGPLRLHDDAVSDVSLHVSLLLVVGAASVARQTSDCGRREDARASGRGAGRPAGDARRRGPAAPRPDLLRARGGHALFGRGREAEALEAAEAAREHPPPPRGNGPGRPLRGG